MPTEKEKVLGRIRALQQKTTSAGCTEKEAEAAAAMVDQLLAQYEMTLDEVTLRSESEVEIITITGVGGHALRFAVNGIAEFCDARGFLDNDDKDISFVGIDVDVQIAEYLALLFWRSLDREAGAYTMMNAEYNLSHPGDRNEMVWSFKIGMAQRLAERLKDLKSKRDFTAQQRGKSLVIAKQPLVKEALETLGIHLSPRTLRGFSHSGAYNAGRTAAEGVAIAQGVAGRPNSTGRLR